MNQNQGPNTPINTESRTRDTLHALMQRLIERVGVATAVNLARQIPELVIDSEGNVLDYDRSDPLNTARLLNEQYEAILGAVSNTLNEQATNSTITGSEMSGMLENNAMLSLPLHPIRIGLVDDHVLVREGLVSLIESQPDMMVVGQAGSVREAIALAHAVRPDVILMDFTLPDGRGDEAARIILSVLPHIKIVFLTVHDDDERLFAAIAAGATGYLLKSVRSADLLGRLRDVIRGDVALSPSIGRRILETLTHRTTMRPPGTATSESLTEREAEILRLIVQGHTNRQIAATLTLSIRTIEYHRANLTSKLGLHSRADLVRYAAEHNLFNPEELQKQRGTERKT